VVPPAVFHNEVAAALSLASIISRASVCSGTDSGEFEFESAASRAAKMLTFTTLASSWGVSGPYVNVTFVFRFSTAISTVPIRLPRRLSMLWLNAVS
jgi:hypothetical protein